ncbi:hypothetical protein LTR22_027053, partial [Elasticomyces elasticus]
RCDDNKRLDGGGGVALSSVMRRPGVNTGEQRESDGGAGYDQLDEADLSFAGYCDDAMCLCCGRVAFWKSWRRRRNLNISEELESNGGACYDQVYEAVLSLADDHEEEYPRIHDSVRRFCAALADQIRG